MARKITVNVDPRMMQQARDEFSYVYGATMAAWADIERALYHWFWYLTGLRDAMARGIYFGSKGFGARLDMIEAAIEHADNISAAEKDFIEKSVNKCRGYSTFRNAIAHGEPIATLVHGSIKGIDGAEPETTATKPNSIHFVMIQAKDVESRGISIAAMVTAHNHFSDLATAINSAVPPHRKGEPIEQYLQQVIGLPNQPYSKSAPSPAAQKQQPQGDHRVNKKEHRAAEAAKKASGETR